MRGGVLTKGLLGRLVLCAVLLTLGWFRKPNQAGWRTGDIFCFILPVNINTDYHQICFSPRCLSIQHLALRSFCLRCSLLLQDFLNGQLNLTTVSCDKLSTTLESKMQTSTDIAMTGIKKGKWYVVCIMWLNSLWLPLRWNPLLRGSGEPCAIFRTVFVCLQKSQSNRTMKHPWWSNR